MTRQGLYCFTPDGMLLSESHHCSSERLHFLLALAQAKFRSIVKVNASDGPLRVDERYHRRPPRGGLVVDVSGKILLEQGAMRDALLINPRNASLSRDHLWVAESEAEAMAPRQLKVGFTYPMPLSLAVRLARFHLVDNIRGEPPMWTTQQIRALKVNLEVVKVEADVATVKLTGFVHLATARRSRTYAPALFGELVYDAKKRTLTRFDALALGRASGEGIYTRGCPEGKFSLGIAFTLADMRRVASQVPPQGAHSIEEYL